MTATSEFENLICTVATFSRAQLQAQFLNFKGRFPIDFTMDYLEDLSVDRLRHIFVALCLQNDLHLDSPELAA